MTCHKDVQPSANYRLKLSERTFSFRLQKTFGSLPRGRVSFRILKYRLAISLQSIVGKRMPKNDRLSPEGRCHYRSPLIEISSFLKSVWNVKWDESYIMDSIRRERLCMYHVRVPRRSVRHWRRNRWHAASVLRSNVNRIRCRWRGCVSCRPGCATPLRSKRRGATNGRNFRRHSEAEH